MPPSPDYRSTATSEDTVLELEDDTEGDDQPASRMRDLTRVEEEAAQDQMRGKSSPYPDSDQPDRHTTEHPLENDRSFIDMVNESDAFDDVDYNQDYDAGSVDSGKGYDADGETPSATDLGHIKETIPDAVLKQLDTLFKGELSHLRKISREDLW